MIRDYALHQGHEKRSWGEIWRRMLLVGKLNGRPTQRMIRPDLSQSAAELTELGWILPLESHR